MAKSKKTSKKDPRDLIAKAEMADRQRNWSQNLANFRASEAAAMKTYGMFTPARQGNMDQFGNVYVVSQYKTSGGAAGRTLSSPEALRIDAERRVGNTKNQRRVGNSNKKKKS